MSARNQSDNPEVAQYPVPVATARGPLVGLAVVLSLLIGVVAGIVAHRYTATRGKPQTALPTPVQPAVSGRSAVLRVDSQLVDGNMQVTIVLDQSIPYDAHRLDQPDRVYIELHDARLAPEVASKTVFVNNRGVSRIRLAQTQPDTVRVVLDLEKRFDYSVVPQSNPAVLVLKLTPYAPTRSKRRNPSSQPKKTSPQ